MFFVSGFVPVVCLAKIWLKALKVMLDNTRERLQYAIHGAYENDKNKHFTINIEWYTKEEWSNSTLAATQIFTQRSSCCKCLSSTYFKKRQSFQALCSKNSFNNLSFSNCLFARFEMCRFAKRRIRRDPHRFCEAWRLCLGVFNEGRVELQLLVAVKGRICGWCLLCDWHK